MVAGITSATELRLTYEQNGFVLVPHLISREEAGRLKDALHEVLRELEASDVVGGVYVGLSVRSPRFREFSRDERVLDVVEALIGPDIWFLSDKAILKGEEAGFETPWHQDYPYWGGAHKATLWLALDDTDERSGCLKFVRGSHRDERAHFLSDELGHAFTQRADVEQEAAFDETTIVSVPASAGTAVVFHDLALHSSWPPASGRDRDAIALTYRDAKEHDRDYPYATAAGLVRGNRQD